MDEVIAENRASVEAVFGKLKGLSSTVRNAPPAQEKMAIGTEHIVLDGEDENALFIREDSLPAPSGADSEDLGAGHSHTLEACGEALNGEASGHPGAFEDFLKTCGSAEYVFVLRSTKEESAQIVDQETFRPGSFEGDVLLYRITDGSLLGGFRVSAGSSDSVMAQGGAAVYGPDTSDRLESDLDANVHADINAKLRQYVPGAIPDA
jgi:hypothetical protein